MNRDHFLFLVIGLLAGFVVGYMVQESMADRQPAPLWHGAGQEAAGPGAAGGGAGPAPSNSAGAAGPGAAGPGAAGQGAAGQGGPAAAMEQVQRLRAYVEQNPTDVDAVRRLANMNYDIANWQRAAELYELLLEQSPKDVDAMTDLGASYRNLGRFDEALDYFRRARTENPDHWQARFNEILVLAFDQGNLDAAQPLLEELKGLQPNHPDVERLAAEIDRRRAS